VAEHDEERGAEHGGGVFQAGEAVGFEEVAGDADDEEVAAAGVEGEFGTDARVGAAQDAGVGVLPVGQGLALGLEIHAFRQAGDVALVAGDQPGERLVGSEDVLRLWRRTFGRGAQSGREGGGGKAGTEQAEEVATGELTGERCGRMVSGGGSTGLAHEKALFSGRGNGSDYLRVTMIFTVGEVAPVASTARMRIVFLPGWSVALKVQLAVPAAGL